MIVIPAIDIEGGRVVRGGAATPDPLAEALALQAAGAAWLHVVDMDRFFGRGDHRELVRRIVEETGCRVQLGGALSAGDDVAEALAWGVDRLVLGMEVLATPAGLAGITARVDVARLGVGIDLRAGQPWARGAPAPLDDPAEALAARAAEAGIRTVVCRDLDRDGRLRGADLESAARVAAAGVSVIAAGGVASVDELARAADLGLDGIIVGRALHAGRLDVREALAWSA